MQILPTLWLGAAMNLVGTGINAASTAGQNKKARRFAKNQWGRENEQDWLKWQAQNNYNRPKEQMKRFKEAGLNPNLIYGQGNSGPAGAVASSSMDNPNIQPMPDMSDLGSNTFGEYANTLQQRLGREQTQANIELIKAQQLKTLAETDTTNFTLEQNRAYNAAMSKASGVTAAQYKAGKEFKITEQKFNQQSEVNAEWLNSKEHRKTMQLKAVKKATAEINNLQDAAALKDFKVLLNTLLMKGAVPTAKALSKIVDQIKSQYK